MSCYSVTHFDFVQCRCGIFSLLCYSFPCFNQQCTKQQQQMHNIKYTITYSNTAHCRSQWPSGLGRGSAAARFQWLRVWIPPGAGMLPGTGRCDRPIPRPEKSYRQWCVIVCDLETSRTRRPGPALGCCAREKEGRRIEKRKKETAHLFALYYRCLYLYVLTDEFSSQKKNIIVG